MNLIKIIPLKVVKTTKGQLILSYATPLKDSKNTCGYDVRQQWYDDIKNYDLLSSYIMKEVEAEKTYRDSYEGKATIVLGALYDDNGEQIL